MATPPEYITIPEAARWAGKNPETVRRWVRGGLLPAYRMGADRRMLVRQADLEAMLAPIPVNPGS